MADRTRSHRVIGWTGAGLVVAVVAAGGFYLAQSAAAGNAIDSHYRTATATTGSVSQQVALSGTVQRVNQASVGFPVNGTVASVYVAVGQHVTAGQQLAALDPTALNVAVVAAQATLASDQAQLVSAQDGTTTSTATTGSTATQRDSTSAASGSSGSGSSGSSGASSAELGALRSTARTLGGQLRTLRTASAAEQSSCAPFLSGHGSTPTGSASPAPTRTRPGRPRSTAAPSSTQPAASGSAPSSTPSPTPSSTSPTSGPSSTPTSAPSSSTSTSAPTVTETVTATVTASPTASTDPQGLRTCLADLRTLSTSMSDVGRTVATLDTQLSTVTSAGKSSAGKSSGGSKSSGGGMTSGAAVATTGKSATETSATGTSTTGANSTAGKGGGGSVAQLQASVAQDQLALTQAKASKAEGTLAAPISGTVAAVGLAKGAPATSADTVTIVGSGAAEVTVDASLAQLPQLADGQRAEVSVPGANGTVPGYVTNVGILAGSDGTYPVTILVGGAPGALASGVDAQTYVTTKTVKNVVTVPVSALQMVSTPRAAVTVVSNGKATSQVVTVGAIGGGVAQVTGLKAGSTVAVANLKQPLPANDNSGTGSGNALTGSSAFTGGAGLRGTRRLGG